MTANPVSGPGAEVKALRVVLFMLLATYGAALVGSLLFVTGVFPSLIKDPTGTSLWKLSFMTRIILERVLPVVVYFFIGWGIFKLITFVSRGEPFNPSSPRYIRKIGYAVLCLAGANAVVDVLAWFTRGMGLLSTGLVWALCNILSTALLGFGFLVIATVLEVGVRLQQDQDLTV